MLSLVAWVFLVSTSALIAIKGWWGFDDWRLWKSDGFFLLIGGLADFGLWNRFGIFIDYRFGNQMGVWLMQG